jgi:hypothetical protein
MQLARFSHFLRFAQAPVIQIFTRYFMKTLFTFCVLLFSLTVCTYADTVTVTPISAGTGYLNAIVQGVPVQIVCIDVARQGPAIGISYQATMSSFTDLSQARRPNLAANYTAAAWLWTQITDPANADQARYIQGAMWHLLNPGAYPYSNPWVARALSASQGFNTTGFFILTPTTNTQEMITRLSGQIASVPEPATLLLLGTGLAYCARRLRKKPTKVGDETTPS